MSELLKKLSTKGSFTGGGSCPDDVKTWTEKMLLINIFESSVSIGIIFQSRNVGSEIIGEIRI